MLEYLNSDNTIINNSDYYKRFSETSVLGTSLRKFSERIVKYQKRGYGVNWIETDKIIPWVKNRFFYGEYDDTETTVLDTQSVPDQSVPDQ